MSDRLIKERKLRITDAMNTYSHALAALRKRGYSVFVLVDDDPDAIANYWAVKGRRDFIADSPVSVLGLVTLWEEYGDRWRDAEVPDEYARVWSWSVPDDDYMSLSDAEFAKLADEARLYLKAHGVDIPSPLTRASLAAIMVTYYKDCGNQ